MKTQVYSGTSWEQQVAYCRALKVGNTIAVSGTTAVDADGNVVGENDIFEQTCFVFEKIDQALKQLDSSLNDVIRTRMFVTDIAEFDHVARAHQQYFEGIDPTATCVEVSRFVRDDLLIEIEVDAVIQADS